MSLTFPTTTLKKPSGLTALPSGFKRPAFGTLYGFDAQGATDDSGGGGGGAFANTLSGSFDGTDDYLQLGNGILTALSGTTYSISMWYKLDQEGYYMEPFSAGGTTGDRSLVYFRARGSGTVSIEFYAGSATHLIEASPFQSINSWVNSVITVDTNGTSTLYVNGVSKAASINVPQVTPTNPVIGCLNGASNFLDGKIDEVAIFDSTLSASDVTSIYNSGVPADLSSLSPVGWWRLGDGTGDTDSGGGTPASGDTIGTVVDQGSGGNNATGTNGPLYSNDVPVAPFSTISGAFDGTDDYLDCGTVSALNSSSAYSGSLWVNYNSVNRIPLGAGAASNRWYLHLVNSTTIQYHMGPSTGVPYPGPGYPTWTVSTLSSSTWYHIAFVHDGTDVTLYLNGSSQGTKTGAETSNNAFKGTQLVIGRYTSVPGTYNFNGYIDEVSLFDSALSASDVTAIYNSGVPADLSSLSPVGWWRMGDGTGDTDSGGGTPASGDTIGTVVDQGSGSNNATNPNGAIYSSTVPS
jgi:hypothetical protein